MKEFLNVHQTNTTNKMKKITIYTTFITIILFWISCNSQKNRSDNSNISVLYTDTMKKNAKSTNLIPPNEIYHSNPIKKDTIIGNYYISYTIQDNNEVIATYPVVDRKGLDTTYYAGREVLLDFKYKQNLSLNKKITKMEFTSYIPKEDIHKYAIYYFDIEKEDNEGVVFSVSLCVPETDVCYWFELCITKKGEIKIKEIIDDFENDET